MQTGLQNFNFTDTQKLYISTIDNKEYFLAKNVCDILELGNVSQALTRVDSEYIILNDIPHPQSPSKLLKMSFVNEAGLYQLIFASRKKEAKIFQNWIFNEVLPQIRKTGSYNAIQQPQLPANYIEALKALVVAEELLEKQAPQIETYNQLHNIEGNFSLQDAMKMLHLKPNKAIDRLCKLKYIYNNNGKYNSYQKYIDNGLFTTKTILNDNVAYGIYITAKGLAYFRDILHKFHDCSVDFLEFKYNNFMSAKNNENSRLAFEKQNKLLLEKMKNNNL